VLARSWARMVSLLVGVRTGDCIVSTARALLVHFPSRRVMVKTYANRHHLRGEANHCPRGDAYIRIDASATHWRAATFRGKSASRNPLGCGTKLRSHFSDRRVCDTRYACRLRMSSPIPEFFFPSTIVIQHCAVRATDAIDALRH
jgi:hypothetical protein